MATNTKKGFALLVIAFLAGSGCLGGPGALPAEDVNALKDPLHAFAVLSARDRANPEVGLSYLVQSTEFPIGPEPPVLHSFEWRKGDRRKISVSSDALGTVFHTMVADSNARRVRCTEGGFFSTRARCSVEDPSPVRSDLDVLSFLDQVDDRAIVQSGRPLVLGKRPCDTFEIFLSRARVPRLWGLERGEERPMSLEVCLDHETGFVHWLEARVPENLVAPDWNKTRAVVKVRLLDMQEEVNDENLLLDYPLSIGPVSCDKNKVEFDLLPLRDMNSVGADLIDPDAQIIRSVLVPVQVEPFFVQSISLVSDFNAKAVRVCDVKSNYCIGVACLSKN